MSTDRYWLALVTGYRGENFIVETSQWHGGSRVEALGTATEVYLKRNPGASIRKVEAFDLTNDVRTFVHLNPDPEWSPAP